MNVLHMVIEYFRTAHRRRICIHVNKEEQTEWNDAGKLVQFAQQKGSAKFDRHPLSVAS